MPSAPADPDALRERLRELFDIPLHRFLGVRLTDPDDPAAGVTLVVEGPALNHVDRLHGGVVTALLDVACYLALLPGLGPDEHAVTHDLTVSLLRGVPAGATLRLRGHVLRRGRAVVFLRAEATVEGEVVAAAQVTKTMVRAGR